MRKIYLVLILFIILTSCITQKKGDLVLFIEPYAGYESAELVDGIRMEGTDLSLRATINYYFTDWFSINTGLGFNGNIFTIVKENSDQTPNNDYTSFYITLPLGLHLVEPNSGFTFGAGITANLPILPSAQY